MSEINKILSSIAIGDIAWIGEESRRNAIKEIADLKKDRERLEWVIENIQGKSWGGWETPITREAIDEAINNES